MGFMLPSSDGPAEKARALIARRAALEAELHEQVSILRANGVDGRSPLVDADGFPRADIDIWAVRHARVRALELRNDLAALTNEIGTALCVVYDPAARAKDDEDARKKVTEDDAFARVDGVTSGSPAARAVREHASLKFIHLVIASRAGSSSWRSRAPIWTSHKASYGVRAATSGSSRGRERECVSVVRSIFLDLTSLPRKSSLSLCSVLATLSRCISLQREAGVGVECSVATWFRTPAHKPNDQQTTHPTALANLYITSCNSLQNLRYALDFHICTEGKRGYSDAGPCRRVGREELVSMRDQGSI
jgi:26S proteasome non-ATPase regulatory subunit 9